MTKHQNFNSQYSICKHPDYLIIFGGGNGRSNDIRIFDDCDNKKTSISSLGCSYDPPQGYICGSSYAKQYLGGSYEFKVVEIETFSVNYI